MFPISIKIVVEEDAVDFGLHLTVADKRPAPSHPSSSASPPAHPLHISPHFINDQKAPAPTAQIERRKKERRRSYGSGEEEGRLQSHKRPFISSYP